MAEILNALWIGDSLGYLERLTIVSALAVGHPFRLYSYSPASISGAPDGVEIRDANEVLEYRVLGRYFEKGHSALGSDFFRYALQAKGLGYWVDLDLYFLKPLDFADDYVFGWEHETSINGAVLRLPQDSAMARELAEMPPVNWRPPYYGLRKSAMFYFRRLTEGDLHAEDYRWGAFGPAYLTHMAKKHRLSGRAQARAVFYPIRHRQAALLCGPPELAERELTGETSGGPPLAVGPERRGEGRAAARLLPRGRLPQSRPRRGERRRRLRAEAGCGGSPLLRSPQGLDRVRHFIAIGRSCRVHCDAGMITTASGDSVGS